MFTGLHPYQKPITNSMHGTGYNDNLWAFTKGMHGWKSFMYLGFVFTVRSGGQTRQRWQAHRYAMTRGELEAVSKLVRLPTCTDVDIWQKNGALRESPCHIYVDKRKEYEISTTSLNSASAFSSPAFVSESFYSIFYSSILKVRIIKHRSICRRLFSEWLPSFTVI